MFSVRPQDETQNRMKWVSSQKGTKQMGVCQEIHRSADSSHITFLLQYNVLTMEVDRRMSCIHAALGPYDEFCTIHDLQQREIVFKI